MAKKKEKAFKLREALDRINEIDDRINEICDLCEKEERGLNEGEQKETDSLKREKEILELRYQTMHDSYFREANAQEDHDEAVRIIRENLKSGRQTEIIFQRDLMMVADVAAGALVPLQIQSILKPLNEGFILDKVGLTLRTGLVGDFVWPMYEMVEATILGEGVALTDTKIEFSKLTATKERIGIAIPVTRQSLNESNDVLQAIVLEVMPKSVQLLLNKIIFGLKKAAEASALIGPFVPFLDGTTSAGDRTSELVHLHRVPTFRELNADMKAKVLETGIDGEHLCYTMTKSMKAILEGEPVNKEGVLVPMVSNERVTGEPIQTTNEMRIVQKYYKKYASADGGSWSNYTPTAPNFTPDYVVRGLTEEEALKQIEAPVNAKVAEVTVVKEFIGLGDWRYQPMGMFGQLRFTIDPFSKARQDAVDFVLNCDYGTKTIRKEAFLLGVCDLEDEE